METSVFRFMRARLEVTHRERAICVISGPWGIGKTTALDAFASEEGRNCVIVKVERGSSKAGASPISVLQHSLEAVRVHIGRSPRATLSNAYWSLRQMLYNYLSEWHQQHVAAGNPTLAHPSFTMIFDEAQYLSRESIDMLRYWNDSDRTMTPFPVGLIFVGNSEFALQEDSTGHSALSGAVRSRALFVEALDYSDVTDADISMILRSLGLYEPDAISSILAYFKQPRVRRDLRSVTRIDAQFRRKIGAAAVSLDMARTLLR